MTMRLSHSSLTGTERTEVAVGTVRLASMFCTVRAGAPRSTVSFGSSEASAWAGFSGSFGTGPALEGWAGRVSARAPVSGAGFAAGVGLRGWLLDGLLDRLRGRLGGRLGAAFGADVGFAAPVPPLDPPFPPGSLCLKKSHHALSTLFGSRWYCSYISSTSHSFAPNAARGLSSVPLSTGVAPFEDSATAGSPLPLISCDASLGWERLPG